MKQYSGSGDEKICAQGIHKFFKVLLSEVESVELKLHILFESKHYQ